ncbi:ferredoxin [Streptomyces sp. NPDC005963]|uniref:ferredoxin n=1 Tax=Streptomyces sp. NPDC005963 TaxID=3156721 RepID=UPI0033DC785A
MPVLRVDLDACQGYANCVVAAPDTYDIDDEGLVVLLKDSITAEDLPRIREAVHSCPVSALTIEDA